MYRPRSSCSFNERSQDEAVVAKHKSSSVNAPKPSAGKQRESSGLNVQTLVRILSPRTRHSGGIVLSSPSNRGNGSLSLSAATDSLMSDSLIAQGQIQLH
jgi:hypothetical protein